MSEHIKTSNQPEQTAASTQRILRYISGLSIASSRVPAVEGSDSRFVGDLGNTTASDTADVLATFRETLSKSISEAEELISEITGSVGVYGGWKGDRDGLNACLSKFKDSLTDPEEEGIPPDDPDATELGISLLSYQVSQVAMELKTLVGHFVEAIKGDEKEAEALREYLKQLDHMSEQHTRNPSQ